MFREFVELNDQMKRMHPATLASKVLLEKEKGCCIVFYAKENSRVVWFDNLDRSDVLNTAIREFEFAQYNKEKWMYFEVHTKDNLPKKYKNVIDRFQCPKNLVIINDSTAFGIEVNSAKAIHTLM